ncbi:MAG: GTPase ObgE [Oligoflexia bacterium]|nr:GTPase ObgE [Oligoflexia bacterium]
MKFIDEAQIYVKSGSGGPGAVSWRREKFVPRGGPDGGDGGVGGDVIFKVNPQMNTLLDFKFNRRFIAQDGDPGDKQNMTGKNGQDAVINVPVGTVIKDLRGQLLADLSQEGEEYVFLKGGRGGKGNQFFKNSINQAPKFSQPGEKGQEADIKLELKLLADVGIIGFPNAGKSTLISRISAARPKIADYPFTTLAPNLGVVKGRGEKNFVVADIPGLIKGAHKGAGLGIKFLRHIERTKVFIHLIDGSGFSGRNPLDDFKDINEELKLYDKNKKDEEGFFALSKRKQIVVVNKADALSEEMKEIILKDFKKKKIKPLFASAVTGFGIKPLLDEVTRILDEEN